MDKKSETKIIKFIIFIAALILAVVALGILIGPRISGQPQSENKYGNLEEFTKCVANSGAKLYGTFWCPHCKNQKEAFGEAKEYLPYIECSTEDGQGQLEICAKEGIDGYPTWKFADGTELAGEQSLEKLSEKTACPLPEVAE